MKITGEYVIEGGKIGKEEIDIGNLLWIKFTVEDGSVFRISLKHTALLVSGVNCSISIHPKADNQFSLHGRYIE